MSDDRQRISKDERDAMLTPEKWAAFLAELEPIRTRLLTWAIKFTRDECKAEDLVSECIIKGARFFETYEPGTNFKSWFYRLMQNTYINHHRHARSGGRGGAHISIEQHNLSTFVGELSVGAIAFEEIFSDEIAEAWNALPRAWAEMLYWADIEDIPDYELAAGFGIPNGTVKSRLHRTRNLLREELLQRGIGSGLQSDRRKNRKKGFKNRMWKDL